MPDNTTLTPARAPSGAGRKRFQIAAVLVVAIVGAVLLNRVLAGKPAPRPKANELSAALDKGSARTYHARYKAATDNGLLTIELWRRPPQSLQMVEADVQGASTQTQTLSANGTTTTCTKASEAWTCEPAPEGAGGVDPIAEASHALAGQKATKHTQVVGGFQATCYAVNEVSTDAREVCVTSDGIPVRLAGAGLTFELTSLERTADPKVFRLPAGVPTGGS